MAVALTIWLIVEIYTGSPVPLSVAAGAPDSTAVAAETTAQVTNLQSCLSQITNKNLFNRPRTRTTPENYSSPTPARAVASALAEQYSLVGVVGGERPQAMLRNRKTNTLHYAAAGELVGELLVKQVNDRSVIVEASGEEIEIGL
jgi:type II secretory pathway component PulC